MAINGNNILIRRNGSMIAGTRSDELQTVCEMIPTSSPDDGEWTTGIAGRKSWSLTCGFLVGNGIDLRGALDIGTIYELIILPRDASISIYGLGGRALLTQCKITAIRGNLVQGSFQFQGAGALERINIQPT